MPVGERRKGKEIKREGDMRAKKEGKVKPEEAINAFLETRKLYDARDTKKSEPQGKEKKQQES